MNVIPTGAWLDRWLAGVAIVHVAIGLALPALLLRTDWLDRWMPTSDADARLFLALFGPTVASWGALMFYLVQHGLRAQQRWAADALIVGVLVWAPLDAALCRTYDLPLGLALDAVGVAAILIPAIWRRLQLAH